MLNFKLIANQELTKSFSPRKSSIIEAIAQGLSNKAIAKEFEITIKAVEQSITSINKALELNNNGLFNTRVRLLSILVSQSLIDFKSEFKLNKVELKIELQQTMLLSCIGLSNKIISKLLNCSEKNIEQRLGQLFDYFGIETKNLEVENPRVLLFINSVLRGNAEISQIKKLLEKTSTEKLRRILQEPELFVETLTKKQNIIG